MLLNESMKRILFVEDKDLLRDMYAILLASESDRWEVRTAASGPAALALMKECAFDVVASDMWMPGMNGVELLSEVHRLYPQTSRIIISGDSDRADAAKALGFTHQFLLKPVDLKTLRSTLVRANGLDAYLRNKNLKALVGRLRVLPSFPSLYLEIMQAIESPDYPLNTIYDLIVKDPGLTAKILQIANSAAFGLSGHINDPTSAIQRLGLNTVRSLALSSHVFASFSQSQTKNFSADALWAHLMQTGHIARAIMRAEHADPEDVEAAFTAGMLHDMGKLMLADSLPRDFQKVLELAADRKVAEHEIEMEVFGTTHAGIAAYLLGLWGLPAAIVEAVAFHHNPENSTHQEFSPLTAVHVADAFANETSGEVPSLNPGYLARVGAETRLGTWRQEADKHCAEVDEIETAGRSR
jgi:HD-like signal output (HDOD) protein